MKTHQVFIEVEQVPITLVPARKRQNSSSKRLLRAGFWATIIGFSVLIAIMAVEIWKNHQMLAH